MKFRTPLTGPPVDNKPKESPLTPGAGLSTAINYYADFGGCGLWRMLWPAQMINAYGKGIINNLTVMMPQPQLYETVKSVRIQRQASKEQLKFATFLHACKQKNNFKLIYEIDDIVIHEDIPAYNKCRDGFADPEIRHTMKTIIDMCDEFSVVSPYMKQYYASKLNIASDKITVVPNFAPRFWIDRFYNPDKLVRNYNEHKGRPRIGFCGSGTHFDVAGRTLYNDDFAHVARHVIGTIKKYKWVFLGGVPPVLKTHAANGDIEVVPWQHIFDFPYVMDGLNLNAVVAPLADNPFNRAKANIKVTESGAYGIPGTFQNLDCYNEIAPFKFDTGEEMIQQLQTILKDESGYMEHSMKARAIADKNWLENNLDYHTNLYFK